MTRSQWKGVFSEVIEKGGATVTVWSRRSTVLPHHVGHNFLIHNGKGFVRFKPSQDTVGHKFGEFAISRKKGEHKKQKKGTITR